MAWIAPKVNWDTVPKNPKAEDINRIEGNIAFLKGDIETKKGLIVDAINYSGGVANITQTHIELSNEIKAKFKLTGTAVAGEVLSGKTFYKDSPTKLTGTIPSKGAATITPSTVNQIIAAGQYLSGIQTISGDADLVAGNIKLGVDLFGIVGTMLDGAGLRPMAAGSLTIPAWADVPIVVATGLTFTPKLVVMVGAGYGYARVLVYSNGNSPFADRDNYYVGKSASYASFSGMLTVTSTGFTVYNYTNFMQWGGTFPWYFTWIAIG